MTITVTGSNYGYSNANLIERYVLAAKVGSDLASGNIYESSESYPGYDFLLSKLVLDDLAPFATTNGLYFSSTSQFGVIASSIIDQSINTPYITNDKYRVNGLFVIGSGNSITAFSDGTEYGDNEGSTFLGATGVRLRGTSGSAGDNYFLPAPIGASGLLFGVPIWTGLNWNFTQFMNAAAALRFGFADPLNAILNSDTYLFNGGSSGESFTGYALNDTIFGNGGSDTLSGGAGNDSIEGGDGSDTLYGGDGLDTLKGGLGVDALVGDAGADVLEGNQDDDELQGGDGGDSLFGNDGDDRLYGDMALIAGPTGNDTLDGGAGLDTLWGGTGDDTYIIADITGSSYDVVVENAAAGIDTVVLTRIGGAPAYVLPGNVENLTAAGVDAMDLNGNSLDNVLTGNSAANRLSGLVGYDTLIGGLGDDVYILDSTSDSPAFVLRPYDQVVEGAGGGFDTVIVWRAIQSTRFSFITFTNIDTYWTNYTLPDNIEAGTVGGTDDFNLTGNGLNNILTGNGVANLLDGAGGNDILDGGLGRDTLVGGAGNDTYYLLSTSSDPALVNLVYDDVSEAANGGYDTIIVQRAAQSTFLNPITFVLQQTFWSQYVLPAEIEEGQIFGPGSFGLSGNAGNNRLVGSDDGNVLQGLDGNDTLVGFGDADSLLGGIGNDSLDGGLGNDTLDGGVGADIINGGDGIDTLSYASSVDGILFYMLAPNLNGGDAAGDSYSQFEIVRGSGVNDRIYMDNGANSVEGGGGAFDTVELYGGNDSYAGGSGFDYVLGGAGDDVINVGDGGSLIYGEADNDRIQALSGSNNLNGGTGDDTIIGGTGQDVILGGAGQDSISGDPGDDFLFGEDGNDRIFGYSGNDQIQGGLGLDSLYGDDGVDVIQGGADADFVVGGAQNDFLFGDAGNDALYGDDGNDQVFGGADDDRVVGGAGVDILVGGDGNDTLEDQGVGELTFSIGGNGNDTIIGTSGQDQMWGGAGADVFETTAGNGYDIIFDFQGGPGIGDQIRLLGTGITSFAQLQAENRIGQAGANTQINLIGAGNVIFLINTTASSLVADDFLFA